MGILISSFSVQETAIWAVASLLGFLMLSEFPLRFPYGKPMNHKQT